MNYVGVTVMSDTTIDYVSMEAPALLTACGSDADKWSEAFCQYMKKHDVVGLDQDYVRTWFANAIMNSLDTQKWNGNSFSKADIGGAVFDFMGFLTSRPEVITVSGSHEPHSILAAYKEWADKRGIPNGHDDDDNYVNISNWHQYIK